MNALVSVIIPTFNSKQYVCDAIDSALAQTYRDIEIIVVDDGSADGTGDLLKDKYGGRIKYIYKENGGPASARNLGIKNTKGEFIAFLDADDLWEPDKLSEQIHAFKPETLMVGCLQQSCNDGLTQAIGFEKLALRNCFPNSGVVARRSAIEKAGWFDERPEFRAVEDWDMWLRLARAGQLLLLQRNLIILRVTENSISAPTQAEKMLRNETAVLKKHLAGRLFLYCRALSNCYLSAAWAFSTQGQNMKALQCMLSCFLFYPITFFQKKKLGLLLKIVRNLIISG